LLEKSCLDAKTKLSMQAIPSLQLAPTDHRITQL